MDKFILGRNIYRARKERGFTGERLSELCNINPSYLRAIESGSKTPSLQLFVELCGQLRISPSYLLDGVTEATDSDGLDKLNELCKCASPSQLRLITAMIEAALKICDENL